jgi:hypothetical protein
MAGSRSCRTRFRRCDRAALVGSSMHFGILRNVSAPQLEERPNNLRVGEQRRQSARAGISQNADEYCLDLVVECVGGCDRRPKLRCVPSEEAPARHTPLVLRGGGALHPCGCERQAKLPCTAADQLHRSPGRCARSMVEAGNQKGWTLCLWKGGGSVQQNHRVDSAGYSEQHAAEPVEFCSDRMQDLISFMPATCHGILI